MFRYTPSRASHSRAVAVFCLSSNSYLFSDTTAQCTEYGVIILFTSYFPRRARTAFLPCGSNAGLAFVAGALQRKKTDMGLGLARLPLSIPNNCFLPTAKCRAGPQCSQGRCAPPLPYTPGSQTKKDRAASKEDGKRTNPWVADGAP